MDYQMFGIQYELVKKLAIILGGIFVGAAFAGFALLKFYEEFQKGIEQKSRLRIWSAFFGLSFTVLFFIFIIRSPL